MYALNAQGLQVPVKPRLKLGTVVRLDDPDAEREPAEDVVDKADGGALIAGVVDLQHSKTGAVIDRRELIETFLRARDALEELHIQLEPETGLCLLVALPALRVRPILLVRWKPVYPVTQEDAMHRRHGQRLLVKSAQVVRDLTGAKVIVLPQIQSLADDLARRGRGRPIRSARPVPQTGLALRVKPTFPSVVGLARDPEPPTCRRDIPGTGRRLPDHPDSPRPQPHLL